MLQATNIVQNMLKGTRPQDNRFVKAAIDELSAEDKAKLDANCEALGINLA
jgi:hypothetical protein